MEALREGLRFLQRSASRCLCRLWKPCPGGLAVLLDLVTRSAGTLLFSWCASVCLHTELKSLFKFRKTSKQTPTNQTNTTKQTPQTPKIFVFRLFTVCCFLFALKKMLQSSALGYQPMNALSNAASLIFNSFPRKTISADKT